MTAVAVWDHRPTADELLEARVQRGWQPTASDVIEGNPVLGHAACLVPRARVAAARALDP